MQEAVLALARERGADLAGWAALNRGELSLYSLLKREEARKYHSALVIAKRHKPEALANLHDRPTVAYDKDYRRLNVELYDIIRALADFLTAEGVTCKPVKPSETLDGHRQRGLISHRALAERAGLGVRGRNNLLITTPNYPGLRLCSLLAELKIHGSAKPIWPYPCKECDNCRQACPAHAIGPKPADFRLDRCMAYLEKVKTEGISPQICGVCMAVCK